MAFESTSRDPGLVFFTIRRLSRELNGLLFPQNRRFLVG